MAWTKTPPTAVGFYWYRDSLSDLAVAECYADGNWAIIGDDRLPSPHELLEQGGEWWSEPIRPPEL